MNWDMSMAGVGIRGGGLYCSITCANICVLTYTHNTLQQHYIDPIFVMPILNCVVFLGVESIELLLSDSDSMIHPCCIIAQ
jgi:hypothetical protein